jgi:hypothetical protein
LLSLAGLCKNELRAVFVRPALIVPLTMPEAEMTGVCYVEEIPPPAPRVIDWSSNIECIIFLWFIGFNFGLSINESQLSSKLPSLSITS